MKIVLLDTETTGAKEEDRICQLSFLVVNEALEIEEVHDTYVMPPLPIGFEAMAIHHITPEMIMHAPRIEETKAFERLHELNTPENIMVIQNAKFDLEMLFKEDFENRMRLIDTFRCIKQINPEGRHGLQYNRYALGLYKKEKALSDKYDITLQAHDALSDVIVLKLFLDYLLEHKTLEELITLTLEPILYSRFYNGKYRREEIKEVAIKDPDYINFMLGLENLEFDLRYSLNYWKNETEGEQIYRFSIGRFKGKEIKEIAQIDISYLRWAFHNMSLSKGFKEEIEKFLG